MNDEESAEIFLSKSQSENEKASPSGPKSLQRKVAKFLLTDPDAETKKSVRTQIVDNHDVLLLLTDLTDSKCIQIKKEDEVCSSTTDGVFAKTACMGLESVRSVRMSDNQLDDSDLSPDGLLLRVRQESVRVRQAETAGEGIGMDNFVQVVQPGAREEEGPVHPVSREGGDGGCDGEFLRLLDPDFKPDFLFRPGDYLPPWAADCLGSWPDLTDEWWDNEDFRLSAAGSGHHHRPSRRAAPIIDPTTKEWEAIAREVISGRIKVVKTSEFKAIEIGLRAIPYSRICRQAVALIDLSDL